MFQMIQTCSGLANAEPMDMMNSREARADTNMMAAGGAGGVEN